MSDWRRRFFVGGPPPRPPIERLGLVRAPMPAHESNEMTAVRASIVSNTERRLSQRRAESRATAVYAAKLAAERERQRDVDLADAIAEIGIQRAQAYASRFGITIDPATEGDQ